MSKDQEDAQSHAFCRCPVLWSARKDAQVAREMDTATTHNANVELRKEQPAQRRASHVGSAIQFANQAARRAANQAAEEQRVHLKWEGAIQNASRSNVATSHVGGAIQYASGSNVATSHVGRMQVPIKLRLTWESRPRRGREQFTWELRITKHSCKQLVKTWLMLKLSMTWLTRQSWNTHILTKMRNSRNGNNLSRDTSMKTMERLWILCRSEQVSTGRWCSWDKLVLVNRATVRRRERCGQHDGVTDGKVTQCAVGLWFDSSEKEQIPVHTRVHQDQLQRGS